MTTYRAIASTETDADSPLTVQLATAWTDNVLAMFEGAAGAPRLQSGAIDTAAVLQANIASGAVGQTQLSTSQGTVSNVTSTTVTALSGGEYTFMPEIGAQDNDSTGVAEVTLYRSNFPGTGGTVAPALYVQIAYSVFSDDTGIDLEYRYINASPPYNLGDGDVGLFVFADMVDGKPTAIWVAEDPPWAHNGPTNVRPDFFRHGKKCQYKDRHQGLRDRLRLKRILEGDERSDELLKEVEQIAKRLEDNYAPLTHEIKNADMGLIPHPYIHPRGEVVMLNPPETDELLIHHCCGDGIGRMLSSGDLVVGDKVKRKTPDGVQAVKWRKR